ncbi:MAG: AraC family transcriptional regulator ligand-binding domain-containing protein [Pseudomonadota bacterium]
MQPAGVATTTATGMGPLPEVLERMAGTQAVDRAFESVGLPLALMHNQQQRIPMAAMIGLFDAAEKQASDEVFGLRVGLEMRPGAYGLWTRYSGQGETARDALRRLCQTIGVHQSGGAMHVALRGRHIVWTYTNPTGFGCSQRAHAEHVAPVMIAFLRPFFGPTWLPDWIGLPFEDDGAGSRRSALLACPWRYADHGVSLSFPAEMLDQTRAVSSKDPMLTKVELYAERKLRDACRPETALREIIALRLLDGKVDIDGAAHLSGQSLRTFQRQLDQSGLTYSKLLARVRCERATALLQETEVSITDIGLQVGFADPANFTRAFRSWTGKTPSQYRKDVRMP